MPTDQANRTTEVKSTRFGTLQIEVGDLITAPMGLLGFPELKKFCLVDPGDDTLILWLQSLDRPEFALPLLEPKIFRPDYAARLSPTELRELKLENVNQSAVFTILTIPADVSAMSANLKAPIVVNLKEQIAKQVVLQDNDYSIKHPVFKELRAHLITMHSQRQRTSDEAARNVPISIRNIPPSLTVKSLSV